MGRPNRAEKTPVQLRMLSHTRTALLRAVTACPGCREQEALHCLVCKLGVASDVILATALLTRYAKRGLLVPAQRLFDEMPRRDLVAFNAMLAALGASGRIADARALFDRMPDRAPASWNTMITCYCRAGDLASARDVFEASLRAMSSSLVSWNAMIDGYCKAGLMDAARELFNRMGSSLPDVVTWNTMMAGYLRGGDPATAVAMFHRLMHIQQDEGAQKLRPTTVTMTTVVTACTQVRDFALGRQIHLRIRQQGTRMDAVLSNALIDMYFKCGSVDRALEVFRTMPCIPNLFCWNTVIAGLGVNGRGEDAVRAFHDMVEGKRNLTMVKPDAVTFVAVLSACSHSGLVPAGRKLFSEMLPMYGVQPQTEHYGCMVDLLCRAGHVDEAARLVQTMPGRPNAKVLGSLLLDARTERGEDGVRLSEWAASRISELDLWDGAAYGLSNVYASLQRWDHVEKHRREVRAAVRHGKGPRHKQPGRASYDLASSGTN
ncbi:pentatricopeptide repeat-containing protein At3g29230-like [Phragmites australis]|uniref:pentatricopeptide repeat-containing protein At3g29230-like n=1 Tax=Phragmites australis TaxID=29695 RepID=UPI002D79DF65|nr:pentatricopeptide repeat-containing protein At3g29230-like [Phragmites australis]